MNENTVNENYETVNDNNNVFDIANMEPAAEENADLVSKESESSTNGGAMLASGVALGVLGSYLIGKYIVPPIREKIKAWRNKKTGKGRWVYVDDSEEDENIVVDGEYKEVK